MSLARNLCVLAAALIAAAPRIAHAFTTLSSKSPSLFFVSRSHHKQHENHPRQGQGVRSFSSSLSPLHAQEGDDDSYQLSIEYCTGCRWNLKAYWLAQEVLSTFSAEPKLSAVTVVPSRPSINPPAVFTAEIAKTNDATTTTVLWDRKEDGGFPEAKELKQKVRDLLSPEMYLGHSDTADKQEAAKGATTKEEVIDLSSEVKEPVDTTLAAKDIAFAKLPNVAITYCCGCKWLLRAAYYAQELTTTFSEEINSLTLIPSRPPAKGGAFVVTVTTTTDSPVVVWDRFEEGGFPEPKVLKQKIRDLLNPEKDLGHIDGATAAATPDDDDDDEMSDDEAEDARNYFGVA